MRSAALLFLLGTILSLSLNSCGPSPSPTVTPVAHILTPTLEPPTLTPVVPTATITSIAKGETIVITSVADSGSGTLRQALLDAQSGDIITFDPTVFPPGDPATIQLKNEDEDSALPNVIQGGLTIDASNAGVILDGRLISGDWVIGLEIDSSGNIVRGLQFINFTGPGIALCGGSNNTIGGDRRIGKGPIGQGNLTSRNGIGIELCGSGSHNTIAGNIVGTDHTETKDWGNRSNGIMIESGWIDNMIGPGNVIAHNDSMGILIWSANAFGNTITQNSIYNNSFGIRLAGGNTMLSPPQISNIDMSAGTVTGSACANCIIEIFSTSSNEGDIYEGQTKANSMGTFTYDHGVSFTGPYLTATATDADGNTSEMRPKIALIQEDNNTPIIELQPLQSSELEDNKIGINFNSLWRLEPEVFPDGVLNANHILNQGVKRARFAINSADPVIVHWDKPENSIEQGHDEFITTLADNGITITYVLSFWDKEYVALGGDTPSSRFKTEDGIQRYLDYVRFIVHHFKDRVEYFEIWNEPDIDFFPISYIELEDYINLVKRTVPVIRQEYPEAKIVVGGAGNILDQSSYDYLFGIINSDEIMPLVDVVSWHGMYGISPEHDLTRQYYYEYPSIVRDIKETASAYGFEGEYVADELVWWTPATPGSPEIYHSEFECAKYYARGIIMNLGMDVSVSQFYAVPGAHPLQIVHTVQNLTTIMSGAEPTDFPVEMQSEATNLTSYGFKLSNGDNLLAIWNDGVAVDYDPGTSSTVIIPGFAGWNATGVDVVNGIEQELITSSENGDLVIRDFLLKDYPIILRFTGASSP